MQVVLDTTLTEELRIEGMKRELIRAVNHLRKEAKLTIKDRINLHIQKNVEVDKLLENYKDEVTQAVLADTVQGVDMHTGKISKVLIGGNEVIFGF